MDSKEELSDFVTHIPRLVNDEDNSRLLNPFTEEEINNVIWKMEPYKSPGLDGFSIHFYIICWDIIKVDMYQMIKGSLKKIQGGRQH